MRSVNYQLHLRQVSITEIGNREGLSLVCFNCDLVNISIHNCCHKFLLIGNCYFCLNCRLRFNNCNDGCKHLRVVFLPLVSFYIPCYYGSADFPRRKINGPLISILSIKPYNSFIRRSYLVGFPAYFCNNCISNQTLLSSFTDFHRNFFAVQLDKFRWLRC